jgi:hypothetical protein
VSNVPFPILSARRFPMWKRRTSLLYNFRLFDSRVSSDFLFGASALALFALNELQQAPRDALDRLLANKPELNCLYLHFFLNN